MDDDEMAETLQVGPTTEGMVRIMVGTGRRTLSLDFDPGEAEEIAEEIRASAERARAGTSGRPPRR